MRKKVGIIKSRLAAFLIVALSINSFGAIVSDNDGAAFITKAEFDALKSSFQSQIDTYNQSIDSKIDGAIAAYLSGLQISKEYEQTSCLGLHRDSNSNKGVIFFVGTNATDWFQADSGNSGTIDYTGGMWNRTIENQTEIEWTGYWNEPNTSSPLEWYGPAVLNFYAKWQHSVPAVPSTNKTIFIITDNSGRAKEFKAQGRVVWSRELATYHSRNAGNWFPLRFRPWPDGALGEIKLSQIGGSQWAGNSLHQNNCYMSIGVGGNYSDNQTFNFEFLRNSAPNNTYPSVGTFSIVNPDTGVVATNLSYVPSTNTTYRSTGIYYQYLKSSWVSQSWGQYGTETGVYVPSALIASTSTCVFDNWPSSGALKQVNYDPFIIEESGTENKVPANDTDHWMAGGLICNLFLNGIGLKYAKTIENWTSGNQIKPKIRVSGYLPELNMDTYKNVLDVHDSYIYRQYGEDCSIGSFPLLCKTEKSGTMEWSNIKFRNGNGGINGTFEVFFSKDKIGKSDIISNIQITPANPKPFKWRLHGSNMWSAEVNSFQPVKGSGYDFQFNVEKNEKIYFGVYDKSDILRQVIVAEESDNKALKIYTTE